MLAQKLGCRAVDRGFCGRSGRVAGIAGLVRVAVLGSLGGVLGACVLGSLRLGARGQSRLLDGGHARGHRAAQDIGHRAGAALRRELGDGQHLRLEHRQGGLQRQNGLQPVEGDLR